MTVKCDSHLGTIVEKFQHKHKSTYLVNGTKQKFNVLNLVLLVSHKKDNIRLQCLGADLSRASHQGEIHRAKTYDNMKWRGRGRRRRRGRKNVRRRFWLHRLHVSNTVHEFQRNLETKRGSPRACANVWHHMQTCDPNFSTLAWLCWLLFPPFAWLTALVWPTGPSSLTFCFPEEHRFPITSTHWTLSNASTLWILCEVPKALESTEI